MVKNSCAAKAKHYSSLSVSSLKCSPHPTPSSWQHDWGCLPLSSPPGCNRLRARNRKKRFLEQGLSTASVRKCVDRWWKGAEAERQLNKSDKRIKQTRSQVEENRGGKEHCSSPAPKSAWTILVVWGTLPASLAVFGKECVWWLHLDTAELAMAPWPSTFGHTWRPPPSVNTQFPWLFSCLNLKTNKGNITKSQTDQAVIHDAVSILLCIGFVFLRVICSPPCTASATTDLALMSAGPRGATTRSVLFTTIGPIRPQKSAAWTPPLSQTWLCLFSIESKGR